MQKMTTLAPSLVILSLFALACPMRPEAVEQTTANDASTGGRGERVRVETRKDPAADQAFESATQSTQGASGDKVAAAYAEVAKSHPNTTSGQEALYRAGLIYFDRGDFAKARSAFNQLLFENPLFDRAQDAKLKLGLSALKLGAYRDAHQTLSALVDHVPSNQKDATLKAVGQAAEGEHLYGEALQVALKALDDAPSPEEKSKALERVTYLVEDKVPFVEVLKAQSALSTRSPAWPVLTFKLAKIYYHVRDWNHLAETLRIFLQEAPQHPFAEQARAMLARSTRRADVNPNVVGIVLPLSGKYKPLGEAVMRGIKLALKGSDIVTVVKDAQGDVNLAGQAVEDLVFDQGAIAVLGPLLAEDSKRAALVAEDLQVPLLTLSRSEHITEVGPFVFRNMLTNSAQADALAEYSTKVLGIQKFAMLYPDIPYGTELANDFWDALSQRGGEVRGAESYSYDQTTFTSEAKKLVGRYYLEDRGDYADLQRELSGNATDAFHKRKAVEKARHSVEPIVDFDALFIPDDWRRVGLVAPALAVEDIITNACDPRDLQRILSTTGKKTLKTVTLLGSNQWNSPKGRSGNAELMERAGKFVQCSVYVDGFYADSIRPATQKFVGLYRDAYKDSAQPEPGLLEAIGYDSAMMFRRVMASKTVSSRALFRDKLSSIKNFEGATGTTHFDRNREASKPLFFLTIDREGIKEISPTEKPGS